MAARYSLSPRCRHGGHDVVEFKATPSFWWSPKKRANYFHLKFQAVRSYITTTITDGEELAIVWFSSSASERVGLTVIDDASRADLLTHIPTSPGGFTSIGSGNHT